jgi:MerR family Zn(II)-responsive transcriptional regulator of zntA
MLIGQLSKRTGFSRDTIRFYEKIGLINKPALRIRGSVYKDYTDEDVETLLAIRKFKEFGFTLEEIREILEMRSIRVLDLSKLIEVVEYKLAGVDDEIERLHAIRARLDEEHHLLLHQKKSHLIALPDMRMAA